MDKNNVGNYFLMHLPSLLCIICIPFDAIILWQIFEAKRQIQYQIYHPAEDMVVIEHQQQQHLIPQNQDVHVRVV
uniref:Secreted protein n=1 Tax=Panagrolaimus sp. ES5 TaxID=591445 RepID=A0AC34GID6_9BILA